MSEKRELTRAEIVRQRRAQRTAQELKKASQAALKPVKPTVITSRVVTPYVQPKRAAENTRRYNVVLSVQNIALHRPAIHFKSAKVNNWRIASMLLTLLLALGMYLAWTLPYFRVPQASVFGNTRLSKEEINAVLGVQGESIFLIQPAEVETRLRLNYPELASADVTVYLPNHVFVTVTERQPVIRWQQGAGYTWIDANGVAFRPRGQEAGPLVNVLGIAAPPPGSPITDDPLSPPAFINKELVDAILALAPAVPAGATLTYTHTEGLGWVDSRGWEAYFGGSAHDMALKLRVYQSLVDHLLSRGTYPVYINVAYPDAPFYRLAQTAAEVGTAFTEDSGQ